ncbi:NAD(P)H-hydrate dehydratase [Tabrizicola fusiformis]|uniref:NAD(P)H-hydrate dehydratase n=1 Tax=Tabrizicola sp. SY72 TaxID=2741673 RepID=UPI0015749B16|nr:NAD(P)H-hydrate dehydratase [Tabrizicola sp. SY72]NTT85117.1 NAD(P)H-hydrate dehydratase [Tabrizicola sp. SY72]
MTELLTAAQMRAIEAAAIASGQVTGLDLMERAGQGVVNAIFEVWPELAKAPSRAVVLCGPGNNGGDGFVVARLLKGQGWQVEVFLYGDAERLPPDARVNYERWGEVGEVRPLSALNAEVGAAPGLTFDIVVDALFGIGLGRSLPDDVVRTLCNLFRGDLWGPVVSVDLPTGLCADSGKPLLPRGYANGTNDCSGWPALDGLVAEAALTVTFHRKKLGHVLDVGPRHCCRVVVVDIGLVPVIATRVCRDVGMVRKDLLRFLAKGREDHKYSHGHALILSGPSGHGGAARLAARGALRIGAGVVTVGCPPDALPENAARLDAVMLRGVPDAATLAEVLTDKRINALCLGPGLGLGALQAGLVREALAAVRQGAPHGEGRRGAVLDADALTLIARDPALFAALSPNCILTPHAGEFARLFPDIAAKLAEPATKGPAYSKVDATREAAARAGCVVLYKGPDTVIAAPDGRCAINAAVYDRAAPWLATAGSGDVLAGFITGLLARGFSPFDAACTGAWLHVECARSFGPGLIAEDLPEELPKVFRALGL